MHRRNQDCIRLGCDRGVDLRRLLIDVVRLVRDESFNLTPELAREPRRADLRAVIGRIALVLGEAAQPVARRLLISS
jgi:hypothetical protein